MCNVWINLLVLISVLFSVYRYPTSLPAHLFLRWGRSWLLPRVFTRDACCLCNRLDFAIQRNCRRDNTLIWEGAPSCAWSDGYYVQISRLLRSFLLNCNINVLSISIREELKPSKSHTTTYKFLKNNNILFCLW